MRKMKQPPNPTSYHQAIIVLANTFQFNHGETLSRPQVKSRMLLWCIAGCGALEVNGQSWPFLPGDFVFLPWNHAISYHADAHDPFLVGGIHLLPRHDVKKPVVFDVAHFPEEPLAQAAGRNDADWPELAGIKQGQLSGQPALQTLMEYIVQIYHREPPQARAMRSLAALLLAELQRACNSAGGQQPQPAALRQILTYADNHLQMKLSLDGLARFAGLSHSSVGRLFRQHLGCTAVQWLTRRKLEKARELLRTTRLTVAETGQRIGIDDSFYFSKLFKKHIGLPLAEYRKKGGLV